MSLSVAYDGDREARLLRAAGAGEAAGRAAPAVLGRGGGGHVLVVHRSHLVLLLRVVGGVVVEPVLHGPTRGARRRGRPVRGQPAG